MYSESFFEQGLGNAIMNRMLKAAGHQVIDTHVKYDKIIFVAQTGTCREQMAKGIMNDFVLKVPMEIEARGLVVQFPEPVNQKAEVFPRRAWCQRSLRNRISRRVLWYLPWSHHSASAL